MAIILEEAQTELAAARAALADARDGEQEIKDRKSKPASLQELLNEVKFWNDMCNELEAQGTRTGRRVRGGTPSG